MLQVFSGLPGDSKADKAFAYACIELFYNIGPDRGAVRNPTTTACSKAFHLCDRQHLYKISGNDQSKRCGVKIHERYRADACVLQHCWVNFTRAKKPKALVTGQGSICDAPSAARPIEDINAVRLASALSGSCSSDVPATQSPGVVQHQTEIQLKLAAVNNKCILVSCFLDVRKI